MTLGKLTTAAAVWTLVLLASGASAQTPSGPQSFTLAQPGGAAAPPDTITLRDALARAERYDAQFLSAAADATVAHEDRVQARAALLPSFSATTQYLGNQPNGVNPNGRFVSMDGVRMYRAWGVLRQELSPSVLTGSPLRRARAAEAEAAARQEIAKRGLAVVVTRSYYGVVTAERRYATAQESAAQAARFLDVAQRQQRLGEVALSDVIKAQIQAQQRDQAFREATLALDTARLDLAVLVFPDFTENFSVVDDLSAAPALPAFDEVSALAGQASPDLRAAQSALAAASEDVRSARFAMLPTVALEADYGIEANAFALHSAIAAQPELGVLPNLGYAVTINLTVPVWDWGGLRSRVRQSEVKVKTARASLTQTQRALLAGLYAKYNESLVAKEAVTSAQKVVELAAESLRLTNLRYTAGESTALEVVDAQNTLVQARNGADDAAARYRVALADLQTLTGSF